MASLIRRHPLSAGLIVDFFDHTRCYFGDYYLVKLEIVCSVPVAPEYFADEAAFKEARASLGDTVCYRRYIEQMGVPSADIELVRDRLMSDFEHHSLPYFSAPEFPRKLVHAELKKMQKKAVRVPMP